MSVRNVAKRETKWHSSENAVDRGCAYVQIKKKHYENYWYYYKSVWKFPWKKSKIIGLFSEFGCIGYVTKQEKFKKQMIDKLFKAIMVGYANNHTRDTYKLYNPETKRVIMTRDIKWADWKNTDATETLKMFREAEKEYLVPGIEKDDIPM